MYKHLNQLQAQGKVILDKSINPMRPYRVGMMPDYRNTKHYPVVTIRSASYQNMLQTIQLVVEEDPLFANFIEIVHSGNVSEAKTMYDGVTDGITQTQLAFIWASVFHRLFGSVAFNAIEFPVAKELSSENA
jgi:hypothetical protein